jgi:hypothetical protein
MTTAANTWAAGSHWPRGHGTIATRAAGSSRMACHGTITITYVTVRVVVLDELAALVLRGLDALLHRVLERLPRRHVQPRLGPAELMRWRGNIYTWAREND